MAAMFSKKKKEVVRVKASLKALDGTHSHTHKRFCIDPEITSFEVLRSMLSKLFCLRSEFTLFYLTADPVCGGGGGGSTGNSGLTLQSLLNDWDLDAALVTSARPHLRLILQVKPSDDGLEDWDVVTAVDVTEAHSLQQESRSSTGFLESIGKALGGLRSRRNLGKLAKPPMTEAEFKNYMDSEGRLVNPIEFRASVYKGGIEPSLRLTAWPHLLCIYPEDMTSKERAEYVKRKTDEYSKLRDDWLERVKAGTAGDEVRFVTSMVKKDVVRTDRTHPFFAGSGADDDDNCHVVGLFHVLVTYAVHHPEASYCQGMSDIASPLFVVLRGDEALTYACFCALMRRLRANFALDGQAMTAKFEHLGLLLQRCDEAFYAYLRENEADDLFFTYRWLLLELKREFPFDEALLMLEVMWSTLPPDPPITDLRLADPRRCGIGSCCTGGSQQQQPSTASLHSSPVTAAATAQQSHQLTAANNTPPTIVGSLSSSASGYSRLRLSRRSSSGRFISSPPSTLTQSSSDTCGGGVAGLVTAPSAPFAIESSGEFSLQDDDDDDGEAAVDAAGGGSRADDCGTEGEQEQLFLDGCDDTISQGSLMAQVARTAEQIDLSLFAGDDHGGNCSHHCVGDGSRQVSPVSRDDSRDCPGGTAGCWSSSHAQVDERESAIGLSPLHREAQHDGAVAAAEAMCAPSGLRGSAASALTCSGSEGCGSDKGVGYESGNQFQPIAADECCLAPRFACGLSVFYVDAGPCCDCQSHFYVSLPADDPAYGNEREAGRGASAVCAVHGANAAASATSGMLRPTTPTGQQPQPQQQQPSSGRSRQASGDSAMTASSSSTSRPTDSVRSRQPSGSNALALDADRMSQSSLDSGIRSHPSTPPYALARRQSFLLENLGEHQLRGLPPPHEFGVGNPFLVCAAVTLILLHRDRIMSSHMDFNDIVLLFDKMVRKNDVHKVVAKSQALYAEYLKEQDFEDCDGDFSFSFSM